MGSSNRLLFVVGDVILILTVYFCASGFGKKIYLHELTAADVASILNRLNVREHIVEKELRDTQIIIISKQKPARWSMKRVKWALAEVSGCYWRDVGEVCFLSPYKVNAREEAARQGKKIIETVYSEWRGTCLNVGYQYAPKLLELVPSYLIGTSERRFRDLPEEIQELITSWIKEYQLIRKWFLQRIPKSQVRTSSSLRRWRKEILQILKVKPDKSWLADNAYVKFDLEFSVLVYPAYTDRYGREVLRALVIVGGLATTRRHIFPRRSTVQSKNRK